MQAPLVKQAGMPFRSPLRHYLNGLAANVANDQVGAYQHLRKAVAADPALFKPYESIRLQHHARQAYALASMELATVHIMQGAYEDANKNMEDAKHYLPADDPRQQIVEANLAVVKEGMGQYDVAIEHVRNCIEYARKAKNPDKVIEFTATVALIHLHTKDIEAARAVLAELPEGADHPDVIAAQCRIRMIETERDPERLLGTLEYFRKVMRNYPEDQVQRLAVDYGNLCITYISRADAEKNRAVLEQAIEIVDATRLRHPECPPSYWLLSRLHALLGNEKKAEEFKLLHTRKKEEYKNKRQYDKRGRTRCATTT
jgi:tetratricopeptide (TPR) repeat protein